MKKLDGHKRVSLHDSFTELAKYCESNKVGKDIYGSGTFLNDFEREVADFVGMEAAIFLPSGVMAQLIAIKTWGDDQGSKTFACHETCHLIRHEDDAYKELLNFKAVLVGDKNKVPLANDLAALKSDVSSYIHELPMRHLGGDLPSMEELNKIKKYCHENQIKFHIDGARIFETASFYDCSIKEIISGADSMFLSFYKGFGSTSGSMLFGSEDFIKKAKVWLRRFGGNLYQLYSLAIPAKVQFDKNKLNFSKWNEKASEIGQILVEDFNVEVLPYPTKTNMMHMYLPINSTDLRAKLTSFNGVDIGMGVWEENEKGHSRVELSIGDGALELSRDEIKEVFKFILKK